MDKLATISYFFTTAQHLEFFNLKNSQDNFNIINKNIFKGIRIILYKHLVVKYYGLV